MEGISLARPTPRQLQQQQLLQEQVSNMLPLLRWLSRLFCINVIIVAAADAGSDSGSGSAGCRYLKLIDS